MYHYLLAQSYQESITFNVLVGETKEDIEYLEQMLSADGEEWEKAETLFLKAISEREALEIEEDNLLTRGNRFRYQLYKDTIYA